jgi:phosphoglycerate dehydrogenase-like enzyme
MMKNEIHVLATTALPAGGEKRISDVSDQIRLTVIPAKKTEDITTATWENVDVLYTWDILPEPDQAPNLKWVQFKSAGVDAHLNHPLLQVPDLIFTTMSGVITGQIAEYVLMAILAFGQKLPKLLKHQQKHHWPESKEKWRDFMPIELRHSTVGILGYGSIGRQVARLLQPFGCTVLAAKKDVMHPEDLGYSREGMGDPHGEFFNRLYPIEALHSLLKESDFVVVALPLTESTQHILDEEAFESMKESAYVINVGRGGLIDEAALIQALKTKQIAGAALDVFEKEPLPENSPLWDLPNVIISPHISGISPHLNDETLALFVENLSRYRRDLPLHNLLDLKEGY